MSLEHTSPALSPVKGGRRPAQRRRVVAAWSLLLVATGVLGWSWSHPTALLQHGFEIGSEHWTVGTTFYAAVTLPVPGERSSVTIHSASATATINGIEQADGTSIAFYVCTLDPRAGYQAMFSAGQADIDEGCTRAVPAEGAAMSLGDRPAQQLFVAVTPLRPGRVVVPDIDVTYSHGWQRGTQTVNERIVLDAQAL